MPALQVRDFPDELYLALKSYAAANHRSIAQQTIACVEEALSRDKQAASVKELLENNDIEIPIEVAKAAHRARDMNAFAWAHGLGEEPEEVRSARRKKRADLQKRAGKIREAWKDNAPTPTEIAQLIREERDARSAAVAAGTADTCTGEVG